MSFWTQHIQLIVLPHSLDLNMVFTNSYLLKRVLNPCHGLIVVRMQITITVFFIILITHK